MAKLVFDQEGSRFYETGVSECVLFVRGSNGTYATGVAWNGITSISESPEGADETALYADNIKYLSLRSKEEFKGSIECYTYPDAFAECDGSAAVAEAIPGFRATQQARKTFALCFKTKKGNDLNPDAGFIFHVIYGCTAAPAERAYETVNDSPAAMTLSYEITTVPVSDVVNGNTIVTAHIELDSTKFTGASGATSSAKLAAVLDEFYGKDGEGAAAKTPTLKLPSEIYAILNAQ